MVPMRAQKRKEAFQESNRGGLRVRAADTATLPVNGGLVFASRLSSPSTVNSLRVSFLACFVPALTSTKGK